MAATAKQIDAAWSGFNNPTNGKSYSGAIVAFFEAGTTTPKAVWLDKDKTLPSAAGLTQTTLSDNGIAKVFGDGIYKINIYTPNDTGLSTPLAGSIDGATYIPDVDPTNVGYDSISDMRAGTGGVEDGSVVSLLGYYSQGDGGGGQFYWDATSTEADNGIDIIKVTSVLTGRFYRMLSNREITAAQAGFKTDGTGNSAAMSSFLSSTTIDTLICTKNTYKFDSRITPVSNKTIKCDTKYAIFDFTGVLETAEAYCIYADSIANFHMDGIHIQASLTEFVNDGLGKWCYTLTNSSYCTLRNCKASGGEQGLVFGVGVTDSSIVDCIGFNNWYHSIGVWASSSLPARRIEIRNVLSYSDKTLSHEAPVSGIYIEECYDSTLTELKAYNTQLGIRIENSCDNKISNVVTHDNFSSGIELYIAAQRNMLVNITSFDNNRKNADAVDTQTRGNDNTNYSGFNIENLSDNNILSNIITYQTEATKVPFNSGSVEPVLGSLLRGATSGVTGRVRRIDLISGSWAGGDASGTLHIVGATGQFNASENIDNITWYVPYNSGSDKPRQTDTITGATSGASGEVLWPSQQGGSVDWSTGDSEGYLYLVNVSGTFNASETLNNTTTTETNIATTNGAATISALNIATTNGATVIGSSQGFQKYGVSINARNLVGVGSASSYNIINGIQSFNNDLDDINDRGYFNNITNINTFKYNITRN